MFTRVFWVVFPVVHLAFIHIFSNLFHLPVLFFRVVCAGQRCAPSASRGGFSAARENDTRKYKTPNFTILFKDTIKIYVHNLHCTVVECNSHVVRSKRLLKPLSIGSRVINVPKSFNHLSGLKLPRTFFIESWYCAN